MKLILLFLLFAFAAGIVQAGLTVAAQAAPCQSTPPKQGSQSDRRAVAGVDTRDEFDRTPLMRAAACGDLAAAKTLLARGADVNAKTADDYTTLMYAAFYGNADIVEFLLDNGADVNARHKNGLTALIEAAKQHMDAGDVIANYISTVEALLKKGADVSVRDKDGNTALSYAEKYGLRNKLEIVRLLRNAGAKGATSELLRSKPIPENTRINDGK